MTAAIPSYTLSSDWLTIASAFASSSAVAVAGFGLVGRVSTLKPTGWLVVSALVLGILGEMLKGLEIDLSQIFASYTPTLTYNGRNYLIAHTRGDGACGAHALLGSKVNGTYRFIGDVREFYVRTLNEKLQNPAIQHQWEEWMVNFLKDYLSAYPGYYSRLVFQRHDMTPLRQRITDIDMQMTDTTSPMINNAARNTQKELCYKNFIRSLQVRDSYVRAVLSQEYYFSTQELVLMAEMFDKHVTVFNRLPNGTVFVSAEGGNRSHEAVSIFHQGAHFSRCEPMNLS